LRHERRESLNGGREERRNGETERESSFSQLVLPLALLRRIARPCPSKTTTSGYSIARDLHNFAGNCQLRERERERESCIRCISVHSARFSLEL
jgi:hypothetical protein